MLLGLVLVFFGMALIIAEFHMPAFGSMVLAGLVAFVAGALILSGGDAALVGSGLPLLAVVATIGALVAIAVAIIVSRARRRPVVTGERMMVGQSAKVVEDFSETGQVRYAGELWNAHSSAPVRIGQEVRIVKVEGLGLWIEPI